MMQGKRVDLKAWPSGIRNEAEAGCLSVNGRDTGDARPPSSSDAVSSKKTRSFTSRLKETFTRGSYAHVQTRIGFKIN